MRAPKKAGLGIPICSQCAKPCNKEVFWLSHQFARDRKVRQRPYCCRECLMESFEEELFLDKLEAAVEKEKRFLQKRVCPACCCRLHELE